MNHIEAELYRICAGKYIEWAKPIYRHRKVAPGELLFFPTGPAGAHKLTNSSETENLIYIDFDVVHDIDITVYPDSDKIGVWGMGINKIYPQEANVDYYDGE